MSGSADRYLRVLPSEVWGSSTFASAVAQAQGAEIDLLHRASRDDTDGLIRQVNPLTATWGLALMEAALGMTALGGTLADRRAAVVARLRGLGSPTMSRLASVANAFQNGTVVLDQVTEDYRVRVWFTDVRGVPPNLDAMIAALRTALPGHLALEPVFVYTTWSALDDAGYDWNALDALGLDWDAMASIL